METDSGEREVLKVANDLSRVKEFIESKFSSDELERAETKLRKKAKSLKIPYITYLRIIGQTSELTASAQLLGVYLLYIK